MSSRASMPIAPALFGYPKFRTGQKAAPYLPMSRAEMDDLGWDQCDIVLVTGDAYIDHPSFGMAVVGRVLESHGFRVGIIAQPDWKSAEAFKILGKPAVYFGVTAGNMDSMVNRYTSERRIRSNDAYSPDGAPDLRPDRASIVYAQRCKEAFNDVPIVLGGIEGSLRRTAHYDHWSEKVRRSILLDSRADILLYGNAERALVEVTHRIAQGEAVKDITDVRGTVFPLSTVPEHMNVLDVTVKLTEPWRHPRESTVIRIPSYEEVSTNTVAYAQASRAVHNETNPGNARPIVQQHGNREVWLNPPPVPLSTPEMDGIYDLPFARGPHPAYGKAKIPAWDMIKNSIIIERGCFGGCTFCSITEHEGRIIQRRSKESILREVESLTEMPGFTGVVSDLGGPTANMYGLQCKSREIEAACRKPSCVFPDVCPNLLTDHGELIDLYKGAREIPGVKKVLIASGIRYDLAVKDPRYIDELAKHHVGGYLKVAPEHVADGPLNKMMKPGIGSYDKFAELFMQASESAGKKQYLIPYFIAAHPGTTTEDMLELALWLKRENLKVDQVQAFLPSPMSTATAMYHTGKNPLRKVTEDSEEVVVPRGAKIRRLHKAFLRYHDPENWPILRESLMKMGRSDLIGRGQKALIPPEDRAERAARTGKSASTKPAEPPKYRGINTGRRKKR
jgi:uncharacterized radical SAM protein YgiQ